MDEETKARADARLEAALADGDRRDPRPFYRHALRYLRKENPAAFQRALDYFENELIPASLAEDPLQAWLEYGQLLAGELGAGRVLDLDDTGRAHTVENAALARGLLLFLPDDPRTPVLVLRYPADATPSQQAAHELLVEGRQIASAYG